MIKNIKKYELVTRNIHPEDTIVEVGDAKFGGGNFTIIAGPCSVESEEQIVETAKSVKKSGAKVLRGGVFKPRTSPYEFQGLGRPGLKLLKKAKEKTGLPIVTELMSIKDLRIIEEYTDIIQIGARNMQNFPLLREVGKSRKPVLLKRGFSNTIDEWLMSAEYILHRGNMNVILCERGIRTFENKTRFTPDLSSIPVIKSISHLPIVVDPSHSMGNVMYISPLSCAATAIGAHGLMIEVHNQPEKALCDGPQSLNPKEFDMLVKKINEIIKINKKYDRNNQRSLPNLQRRC